MYVRRGTVVVQFLLNYNQQEGTGKSIFTPLILDNKQFFSNKIDRKATKVSAKDFTNHSWLELLNGINNLESLQISGISIGIYNT